MPDSNPERLAPPLNRPDLRPTDSDTRTKEYEFIFKTIQRGRPGTPMPTWGQIDGGPLLDEQVNELALLIGKVGLLAAGEPLCATCAHASEQRGVELDVE